MRSLFLSYGTGSSSRKYFKQIKFCDKVSKVDCFTKSDYRRIMKITVWPDNFEPWFTVAALLAYS